MPRVNSHLSFRFRRCWFWHVQSLHAHGRQQLQRKAKAELALVHPVDKHLDVDRRALGFEPTGEVLVGEAFLLTQVFDKGLGPRFVERARLHGKQTYMVFDLCAS